MIGFWIETIIFIQTYWWLRSPGTHGSRIAWHVSPSGSVYSDDYNYVINSYGRIQSPTTSRDDWACLVNPSGDVYFTYGYHYDVYYSYGRRSPFTSYSDNAWSVRTGGDLDYNTTVVSSYGQELSVHCWNIYLEYILMAQL